MNSTNLCRLILVDLNYCNNTIEKQANWNSAEFIISDNHHIFIFNEWKKSETVKYAINYSAGLMEL